MSNITESFDKVSKIFIEMDQEIESLKTRYGADTKWVKQREEQMRVLVDFQDDCVKEVNALNNEIKMLRLSQNLFALSVDTRVHSDSLIRILQAKE